MGMALFARVLQGSPSPPSQLLSTATSAPVPLPFPWGLLARPLVSSLRLPPLPDPALNAALALRIEPLRAPVSPRSPSTILVC